MEAKLKESGEESITDDSSKPGNRCNCGLLKVKFEAFDILGNYAYCVGSASSLIIYAAVKQKVQQ